MADSVLVPNTGLDITTKRLRGLGTEPNWCAWGTGTTAPVVGNTALQTPGAETRVQGTSSQQTISTSNDTYQVVGTLECNATAKDITEFGLLDAVTIGLLYLRATFDAIHVEQYDKIQFTAQVQYEQG